MTLNAGSVAAGGVGQTRRFPTQLGEFVRVSRMSAMAPHDEWMATLSDKTGIVVPDDGGRPNFLRVAKAISVAHSRSYLGVWGRRLSPTTGSKCGFNRSMQHIR